MFDMNVRRMLYYGFIYNLLLYGDSENTLLILEFSILLRAYQQSFH
jgi:hypothetical protein